MNSVQVEMPLASPTIAIVCRMVALSRSSIAGCPYFSDRLRSSGNASRESKDTHADAWRASILQSNTKCKPSARLVPILRRLERWNSLRMRASEGVLGQDRVGAASYGSPKTACFRDKSAKQPLRIGTSRAHRKYRQ